MIDIKVGDRVRILPAYERLNWSQGNPLGKNTAGTEFEVTEVKTGSAPNDGPNFFVVGDPQGRGIWRKYVEKVEPRLSRKKAVQEAAKRLRQGAISSSALAEGLVAVKGDDLTDLLVAVAELNAPKR